MMVLASGDWKPAVARGQMRHHEPAGDATMPSANDTTPHAAFGLRIALGLVLLAHGALLKLATFGLAGTMGYFASIGYPPALGALVAFGETAAGLALLAGVLVRTASLASLPIVLGAALQHAGNGWVFTAPGGGWEFPAFLAAALLVQAGLGAGAWALPALLGQARAARIA
jgi:putative oxidoreductase